MTSKKAFLVSVLTLLVSLSAIAGAKEVGNGGGGELSKIVQCVPQNGRTFPRIYFSGSQPFSSGVVVRVVFTLSADSNQIDFLPLKFAVTKHTIPPAACGGDCLWGDERYKLVLKTGETLTARFRSNDHLEQAALGNGLFVQGSHSISMRCTQQISASN